MKRRNKDLDDDLKKLLKIGKRYKEISVELGYSIGYLKNRASKLGVGVEYYKDYTCKNCSVVFSDLIKSERKFCCSKCSAEYNGKGKKITENVKNKIKNSVNNYYLREGKQRKKKICETCGKEFLYRGGKANRFCSKKCINYKVSDSAKEKISKKRLEHLSLNKNVKWFEIKNINDQNIKIQGQWEFDFANRCNELNILFLRHVIKFKNCHYYTPDFYLPKYNIFIEIKGYLYSKDIYKMLNVIEEHKIILKMINDHHIIKNFNSVDELLEMKNFNEIYSYDDVNYNDFVKRY